MTCLLVAAVMLRRCCCMQRLRSRCHLVAGKPSGPEQHSPSIVAQERTLRYVCNTLMNHFDVEIVDIQASVYTTVQPSDTNSPARSSHVWECQTGQVFQQRQVIAFP
jgi:hypothetical protein